MQHNEANQTLRINYHIDYYDVLGLKKTATQEEIKNKYKELSKKYHPDRNLDSREEARIIMQQLNAAKETLVHDEKIRADYDKKHTPFVYDGAVIPVSQNTSLPLKLSLELGSQAIIVELLTQGYQLTENFFNYAISTKNIKMIEFYAEYALRNGAKFKYKETHIELAIQTRNTEIIIKIITLWNENRINAAALEKILSYISKIQDYEQAIIIKILDRFEQHNVRLTVKCLLSVINIQKFGLFEEALTRYLSNKKRELKPEHWQAIIKIQTLEPKTENFLPEKQAFIKDNLKFVEHFFKFAKLDLYNQTPIHSIINTNNVSFFDLWCNKFNLTQFDCRHLNLALKNQCVLLINYIINRFNVAPDQSSLELAIKTKNPEIINAIPLFNLKLEPKNLNDIITLRNNSLFVKFIDHGATSDQDTVQLILQTNDFNFIDKAIKKTITTEEHIKVALTTQPDPIICILIERCREISKEIFSTITHNKSLEVIKAAIKVGGEHVDDYLTNIISTSTIETITYLFTEAPLKIFHLALALERDSQIFKEIINFNKELGHSFLNLAIQNQDLDTLKKYLLVIPEVATDSLDEALKTKNIEIINLIIPSSKVTENTLDIVMQTQDEGLIKKIIEMGAIVTQNSLDIVLETKNINLINAILESYTYQIKTSQIKLIVALRNELIFKRLLTNLKSLNGEEVLDAIIKTEQLEFLKIFYEFYPNLTNPFFSVLTNGNIPAIKELIKVGYKLNKFCLIGAILNSNETLFNFLIDNIDDVFSEFNKSFELTLNKSLESNKEEPSILLKKFIKSKPFTAERYFNDLLKEKNNTDKILHLITTGIPISLETLSLSIENDYEEIFISLKPSNEFLTDSLFQLAVKHDRIKVIEYFLKQNIAVTPLLQEIAIKNNSGQAFKLFSNHLLLKPELFDITLKNESIKVDNNIFKVFLDANISPTNKGFQWIISNTKEEKVSTLIKSNIIFPIDALDWAIKLADISIFRLLLENGVKPTANSLHFALENGAPNGNPYYYEKIIFLAITGMQLSQDNLLFVQNNVSNTNYLRAIITVGIINGIILNDGSIEDHPHTILKACIINNNEISSSEKSFLLEELKLSKQEMVKKIINYSISCKPKYYHKALSIYPNIFSGIPDLLEFMHNFEVNWHLYQQAFNAAEVGSFDLLSQLLNEHSWLLTFKNEKLISILTIISTNVINSTYQRNDINFFDSVSFKKVINLLHAEVEIDAILAKFIPSKPLTTSSLYNEKLGLILRPEHISLIIDFISGEKFLTQKNILKVEEPFDLSSFIHPDILTYHLNTMSEVISHIINEVDRIKKIKLTAPFLDTTLEMDEKEEKIIYKFIDNTRRLSEYFINTELKLNDNLKEINAADEPENPAISTLGLFALSSKRKAEVLDDETPSTKEKKHLKG